MKPNRTFSWTLPAEPVARNLAGDHRGRPPLNQGPALSGRSADRGGPPRNKRLHNPTDPATVERSSPSCVPPVKILTASDCAGLIVLLWHAGLRLPRAYGGGIISARSLCARGQVSCPMWSSPSAVALLRGAGGRSELRRSWSFVRRGWSTRRGQWGRSARLVRRGAPRWRPYGDRCGCSAGARLHAAVNTLVRAQSSPART